MIRELLTAAAAVYLVIAVAQAAIVGAVTADSAVIAVVLCIGAGLAWARDAHGVKRVEMVLLWVCVLLFAAYGLLKAGGLP
jgi:uncharacterized membrane protein